MAVPPDELFRAQEADLDRYATARELQLVRMLERARKEMQAEISDIDSFTARRVSALTKQIDDIVADLKKDVLSIGESASDLAEMTQVHLQTSLTAITGLEISVGLDVLNVDILRRFSENNLIHVTTLIQAEKETVKSVLFSKVGVLGQNPRKVAKELMGADSRFANRYGVLENIFRTESSTIYNAQSLTGIQSANQEHGLSLNKRIVETIDNKRNHPISQLLNNKVQAADKPFRIKIADVQRRGKILKRSAGGVLWPKEGAYYVGQKLPAHYRERGVVVPTEREINVE